MKKIFVKLVGFFIYSIFSLNTINGFSTSPNIVMTRTLSDSICIPGEDIIITISLKFNELSNNARGVYIVDNIPNALASTVRTLSVKLDIMDITNLVTMEKDSLNTVYEQTTIFRWILETPPWFTENLIVHPFEEIIVMYSITIPSEAEERTRYNFPNASWIAAIDPFNNPSYEFGFEDFPNPELIVDNPNIIKSKNNLNPKGFYLSQNFPNPFNPSTIISFDLYEDAVVKLIIFNNKGEIITRLINTRLFSGNYNITFNSKLIQHGNSINSGVYYYQLNVKTKNREYSQTKKMVLLK